MKFNIPKDILLKGIQSTQNAVNIKTNLPILSHILIEVNDSDTTFAATDLDMGIISIVAIKPHITGSITIPAKKFFDIIKELPNSDVSISVKKNNLVYIDCQNSNFKIMGLPKDEFPVFPEFKNKDFVTIQQKKLKEMLNLTSFATSHDETRYVLNGVLLVIKPSYLRVVAADGRQLALVEYKTQFPKTHERKVIVPTKTINELEKLLTDEGDVRIFFGENQIFFDMGSIKIVSRLIEGEFPDYEKVLPEELKQKISVAKEKLISALKRVAIFTNQDSQAVKIDVKGNKMALSKNTPYIGEAHEELDVDYKGKDISIGFNPEYLINALKNIDQETINLELADFEKPGVIRVGDEYVYLAMPMQIT